MRRLFKILAGIINHEFIRILHIPEHTRSDSFPGFSFLYVGKFIRNNTIMAGTTKDMSLIKQVLQFKQAGESNRGVSRKVTD